MVMALVSSTIQTSWPAWWWNPMGVLSASLGQYHCCWCPGSLTSLTSTGHQQQWHWIWEMSRYLSSTRKNFNHLCHLSNEKWLQMQMYFLGSYNKFSRARVKCLMASQWAQWAPDTQVNKLARGMITCFETMKNPSLSRSSKVHQPDYLTVISKCGRLWIWQLPISMRQAMWQSLYFSGETGTLGTFKTIRQVSSFSTI